MTTASGLVHGVMGEDILSIVPLSTSCIVPVTLEKNIDGCSVSAPQNGTQSLRT